MRTACKGQQINPDIAGRLSLACAMGQLQIPLKISRAFIPWKLPPFAEPDARDYSSTGGQNRGALMFDLPPEPAFIEIHCDGAELTETGARCPIPAGEMVYLPSPVFDRYDMADFCTSYTLQPVPDGFPNVTDRISDEPGFYVLPQGDNLGERLANAMAALVAYQVELTAYTLFLENCAPADPIGG